MPFNLIPADKAIKDSVYLTIIQTPAAGFPGTTSNAAQGTTSQGSRTITFQFPPFIRSDSKSARWFSLYDTFVYEPEFSFKGGDVRKLSLETTYVVGGPTDDGNWTTRRVAEEIRRIKSYFYASGAEEFKVLPVFALGIYEFSGPSPMFCRGTDVNIKPSETLIRDSSGIYPLTTTVTLNLEMITRVQTRDGKNRYNYDNIPPLKTDWY